MSVDESLLDQVLAALHHSHDLLVGHVTPLSESELSGPSDASEWTIAQVLSHLGSGAEIFSLFLEPGTRREPAPGFEKFQAVWDVWNAKSPADQARDALSADGAFLDQVESLAPDQRAEWQMSLFGADQDLTGVLRMRLGELALHTWDVAAAIDPQAILPQDATTVIIDGLSVLVARAGKASDTPQHVVVVTSDPERQLVLDADADGARLVAAPAGEDLSGALRLPAEAFVRLVYGRLDAAHTPASDAGSPDLDRWRRTFPGI